MDAKDLARRVVERYETDPRLWCAHGCRDESGHLCPGALAADLSGGRWAAPAGEALGEWLHAEPGDEAAVVLRLVHPHDRARRLLRADLGFGDGLTLADLRRLSK